MSEENTETLTGEETTAVDTATSKLLNQFTELQSKFDYLASQNAQLIASLGQKTQVVETPTLSTAQVQEFAANPAKLTEFLQNQVSLAKNQIQSEASKQTWDAKAKSEFPLETDKAFREATAAKIRELTSQGEYSNDHPKLVYRAAQLAANELGLSAKKAPSKEAPTSVAPSTVTRTGVSTTSKSKIGNDDPRVRFAIGAGLKGAALEKFKERLPAYVKEERAPRGRTLMRGER